MNFVMKIIRLMLIRSFRFSSRIFMARVWVLAVLFGFWGASHAQAQITVTPVTWNVIGLDSNNQQVGPNTFQIGARVRNTGATTLTNLVGTFVWDSANPYVNLSGANSVTIRSLAPGASTDVYFSVIVTRTVAAFDTTRRYRITVSNGLFSASTPSPRELYVERLLSQGRNSVNSITGPRTVYVGQTYTYTVNASTATQGYEQLEASLSLSNIVFQVLSIATTYSSPAGATNDKFYADACGWNNDPTSPTYRSCIGPPNYAGGKAGGTVVTTYTVKVLTTGTTTANTLILDFSGSSYHYNADYGNGINILALPPQITLSKLVNPTRLSAGGTVNYTLRLGNTGTSDITVNDFVDVLPTSPTSATYASGSSTFNGAAISNPTLSGSTLTWTGSFLVPAGQTRELRYQVTLPDVEGTYINSAVAHFDGYQIDTTQEITDNAPATVPVTIQFPPRINLNKSYSANTPDIQPGTELTYTIAFSNTGSAPAQNLVINDPYAANPDPWLRTFRHVDFKLGSVTTALGTTGLTVIVEHSNDGGATWTYMPVSGAGGAPAGYDRTVTNIRWNFSGDLSHVPPNNAGSVGFTVRVR